MIWTKYMHIYPSFMGIVTIYQTTFLSSICVAPTYLAQIVSVTCAYISPHALNV